MENIVFVNRTDAWPFVLASFTTFRFWFISEKKFWLSSTAQTKRKSVFEYVNELQRIPTNEFIIFQEIQWNWNSSLTLPKNCHIATSKCHRHWLSWLGDNIEIHRIVLILNYHFYAFVGEFIHSIWVREWIFHWRPNGCHWFINQIHRKW